VISKESELIGRRIKEARHKLGLTQEKLGERADLHYSYIGQMERGNKAPSLKTLKKMASALNIRLETLLEDSPDLDMSPQQLLVQELVATVKSTSAEDIRMYIEIIRHIQNRMRDHARKQDG